VFALSSVVRMPEARRVAEHLIKTAKYVFNQVLI